MSSSFGFLKSITVEQSYYIDCSGPRDTKGAKIFFCFHLFYWNWDVNLPGRLWVLRPWVCREKNIGSIGLWNLGAWCPSEWGDLAENRAGPCQNPAYPLLEDFLKAAYFREMFCFVDSAISERLMLKPKIYSPTQLSPLDSISSIWGICLAPLWSFRRSCKTASLILSSFLELKKVAAGKKHNFQNVKKVF